MQLSPQMTNIAQHFRDCHSHSDTQPRGSGLCPSSPLLPLTRKRREERIQASVQMRSRRDVCYQTKQSVIKSVPHALVTLLVARWSRPALGWWFPPPELPLDTVTARAGCQNTTYQLLPHPTVWSILKDSRGFYNFCTETFSFCGAFLCRKAT